MSYLKTTIVGNVGKDAEMRYLPSGKPVTNFSVAHSESWTNGNGEKQEKTTWVKVVCWGKLAEVCAQYVKKGMLVLAEGKIDASAWTDKEGDARASLELTANEVKFLGKKGESNGESEIRPETYGPASSPIDTDDVPF
jgi:single-strand DNA-binding protein